MNQGGDPLAILRAAHPAAEAATGPDWLAEVGGVVEAITYRWLYWPELVEVAGAVFIDLHGVGGAEVERRLGVALAAGGPGRPPGEWAALVDSFNYFELSQLFQRWNGELDADERTQLALADLLVDPWQARLHQAYPERRFGVRVADPDPDLGVCVEAVQLSPALAPPVGW